MNKYENGKIYKIVCNTTGLIYIGSTIQTLKERLSQHKSKYRLSRTCSSHLVLENNNYDIILIEDYPSNSKKKLVLREGLFQRSIPCVNKYMAGRTIKEYRKDNREKLKQYRLDNIEKIKQYNLQHYQDNKEKSKQYNKAKHAYQTSMGGRTCRNNNSLLRIDPNLFL